MHRYRYAKQKWPKIFELWSLVREKMELLSRMKLNVRNEHSNWVMYFRKSLIECEHIVLRKFPCFFEWKLAFFSCICLEKHLRSNVGLFRNLSSNCSSFINNRSVFSNVQERFRLDLYRLHCLRGIRLASYRTDWRFVESTIKITVSFFFIRSVAIGRLLHEHSCVLYMYNRRRA